MSVYKKLNHSSRSVQDGWMIFFRSLANQYKLKFVWGGSPRTDGETVWLPRLPLDLNDEDMLLVKKHGYHEVGHCLFTNIEYFISFGEAHGRFAQQLLNAVEDPWMEGKVSRRMRAAIKYFKEAPKIYFDRGMVRTGKDNIADAFTGFILCKSQTVLNKWSEFEAPRDEARANFERHFGEGGDELLDLVERIIESDVHSCRSTEDNGRLALRIIETLKQHAEDKDKQDEDEQEEPEDESESDDNPDNGDSDTDGDDDGDSSSAGSDSDESSKDEQSSEFDSNGESDANDEVDQDESSDSTSQDGSGSEGCDGQNEIDSLSMSEKVVQLLNANPSEGEVMDGEEILKALQQEIESGNHDDYDADSLDAIPASGEYDPTSASGSKAGEGVGVEGITELSSNHENAKIIKDEIGNRSQVIAGTLQQLLSSNEEQDTYIGRRGKLQGGKLYRIPMGNTKIYGTTEEVESDVAAISVLADMSYSTLTNGCAEVVRQGLMLFNEVLNFIEADYEFLGFGAETETDVSLIKGFSESSVVATSRIGGMVNDSGSGTPMIEALIEGGLRLTSVDNQRKVIFVLTDGDPCNREQCAEYTNRLRQEGIEVVYLLMGNQVRGDWLETAGIPYMEARDFNEVISAMMTQLRNVLL